MGGLRFVHLVQLLKIEKGEALKRPLKSGLKWLNSNRNIELFEATISELRKCTKKKEQYSKNTSQVPS